MISRFIAKDEVLAIHSVTIKKFGGVYGVRDKELLVSALAKPLQLFTDNEFCRTNAAKDRKKRYVE